LLVSHGALGYLNQLQPKMYEALESIFQTLKPNGVAVLDVGAKEASEDAAQVTIFLRDFAAANDVYPKRIHYEWRLTYLKITRLQ
ncbi:MAG: hypothetical protein KDD48_09380, partial [Bdellovibrionales bacterium]|nr:hypothetical protein [Bdellovibrionales bacterium]